MGEGVWLFEEDSGQTYIKQTSKAFAPVRATELDGSETFYGRWVS